MLSSTLSTLRFNPAKSVCSTFGKCLFNEASWVMNHSVLNVEESISYLGVLLSTDGRGHADVRMKACRRAYYSLQGAGLRARALAPKTMRYLWQAAVRPILTYGTQCTYLQPSAVKELDKTQSSLIKQALGLKKTSRHTALMTALELQSVRELIERARVRTIAAALRGPSRASVFYAETIDACIRGKIVDPRGATAQALATWKRKHQGKSRNFFQYFDGYKPAPEAKTEENGIIDSIKQILCAFSDANQSLLSLILSPF
jgi:hypothetical protein